MPKTTSDVFADPGDIFTPGRYSPTSTRQTVRLTDGLATYSPTITIFATVDTMLALADSLVAAAWTLKTAADNAAAPYVPAGPPKTLRMPPHDPTGVRVKNDSAVVAAESAVEG